MSTYPYENDSVQDNLPSPTSTVFELPLEDELRRDEARFEAYGGDDPLEPSTRSSSPTVNSKESDPNLVTWDGPDDPANPQNWSRWYRWAITWFISVLTVNVYVLCDFYPLWLNSREMTT